jgi:hypothetical protein
MSFLKDLKAFFQKDEKAEKYKKREYGSTRRPNGAAPESKGKGFDTTRKWEKGSNLNS